MCSVAGAGEKGALGMSMCAEQERNSRRRFLNCSIHERDLKRVFCKRLSLLLHLFADHAAMTSFADVVQRNGREYVCMCK